MTMIDGVVVTQSDSTPKGVRTRKPKARRTTKSALSPIGSGKPSRSGDGAVAQVLHDAFRDAITEDDMRGLARDVLTELKVPASGKGMNAGLYKAFMEYSVGVAGKATSSDRGFVDELVERLSAGFTDGAEGADDLGPPAEYPPE